MVRVHPDILKSQRTPSSLGGRKIWEERFEDIRCFERHMARSGTAIRKFFLNVSKKEQKTSLSWLDWTSWKKLEIFGGETFTNANTGMTIRMLTKR